MLRAAFVLVHSAHMQKPKIVAIVGPTASGKTSLSIEVAKHFNGEVISADSRQVYKGLDIGSGKVTKEEMGGIPHYLLDIAEPSTTYTGADFKRDASVAIEDILNRDRLPIIAGGTFFYIELLRGTMQAAPVEPNEELREELEKLDDEALLAQLSTKDPERAANIDIHNRRRIIRSLEIIDGIGKVPEVVQTESPYDWLLIGIDIEKEQLHKNIHLRLQERLQNGMIEEVATLLESGITSERLESLGLEYRYINRFLSGELSREAMEIELETKIKQFAKRQMTWLRKDESIEWFKKEELENITKRVEEFLADK